MTSSFSFQLFTSAITLPLEWDTIAVTNLFLTRNYLQILEESAPENMDCHFIGIYQENQLKGIALGQFLDLNQVPSYGARDKSLKTNIRNFAFKNFGAHVLVMGNNMLTGQNAMAFASDTPKKEALACIQQASKALEKKYKSLGKKVHISTYKDFEKKEISDFEIPSFKNYYRFSTQPSMLFRIKESWKNEQDYIDALSKKYRDQYKRARKKAAGIEKRKLHLEDIIYFEERIYELYLHVAKNAPFNTFFLAKNHFQKLKEILKDQFLFYGYFIDDELIGFNTLLKNGNTMETYFLGYDDLLQREKMLYLNMLYDMIAYSINKGFNEIVFARTALEIKSSVGAVPVDMFGLMRHSNPIINRFMPLLFPYLEPETIWQERNPFK
ncbi:GNAT family N-acetyltransferase [Flavobacterium turcicum]|uniref:GNAT family N-acetyltransferase n=1 Tax=Flavobacterium turcicum TaxID=2764718 RepID=A0ABR7JDE5_9FLAO|nr:GNAT family N-acetyltransferase [Flavobacterium turcicum]MBC5862521.1 GNAT family N-acetyltransferase [Flavobacterium turcicum]NHL01252.1 GNAT family N-acetyltransferase [Flavobacterium turcicum]